MLLHHDQIPSRATRRRRVLAVGLESAVRRSHHPAGPLTAEVPVDRAAVRDCADRLLALARLLRADVALPDEGVRAVRRLLTDGAGPLFVGRPRDLPDALDHIETELGVR